MKAIAVVWVTCGETIGVVLGENEFYQQAYMKVARGYDKDIDIQRVLDLGAKLTVEQAVGFFGGQVDVEKYKKR